jgi:hypothetical protein
MDTKPQKHGYFVISLDFELFWGMFDKATLDEYGENVLGERTAIPRMLELFEKYGIHATWATVGMLMTRNRRELLSVFPPLHLQPLYEDMRVSAYEYIKTANIGDDEKSDPYHFGPSLVNSIQETPHQEIGNHTFSHYYCIDGHSNDTAVFARDLEAHTAIAHTYNVVTESMVFPRNQPSEEALRVCAEKGIHSYRGNENHILYRPRKDTEQSLLIRGFRLLDHYINLSGHHTYPLPTYEDGFPLNIPASRFLRPWSRALRFFEWLRLHRIKKSMTHAAKRGEIFHLWWHPHNFGINQNENFKNLEALLEHFTTLKTKYNFESASMRDLTQH